MGIDIEKVRDATRFAIAYAVVKMLKRVGTAAARAAGGGRGSYLMWSAMISRDHRGVFWAEMGPVERIAMAISPARRVEHKPDRLADYTIALVAQAYEAFPGSREASERMTDELINLLPRDIAEHFVPLESPCSVQTSSRPSSAPSTASPG